MACEAGGAASVRSVALCTGDDPYLRPLLEARGIEVAFDGERRGSRAKVYPAADRIAAWSTLQDDPIRTSVPLVVDGSLVAHAVVFHDGAPIAPTVADLAGSEITVVTALKPESKGGASFGMSPIGMAVLNRELAQQAGALVRRTVILSPAVDPVMGQLCEHLGVDTELTPA